MKVRTAYEDYLFAVKRLSPETQKGYRIKLGIFTKWCEGKGLELEDINRKMLRVFFDELSATVSSATQQSYGRTIKAFLFWCSREEDFEDLLPESVPRKMEMPRPEHKILEIFTKDHIERLRKATGEMQAPKEVQVRNRTIIDVLDGTGIRAAELCGLTTDQVFITPEGSHIKVYGKGQKWRVVPLDDACASQLRRYITRFRKAPESEKHVFLGGKGNPLTVSGLEQLVDRVSTWANIQGVRCSPHTFRHSYAVKSLLRGVDIYKLKIRMGHSSITVTEHYLKALDGIIARGAESLYI